VEENNKQVDQVPEEDLRLVYLHGFEREEMFAIMKAVKSVVDEPKRIAFSTTTAKNLDLKVRELIPEVFHDHYHMVWKHHLKQQKEVLE
jgi:hypothetical protein